MSELAFAKPRLAKRGVRGPKPPAGPLGRLIAHFQSLVPDYAYHPTNGDRFKDALELWLDSEGTEVEACALLDHMCESKVRRDGDPPASLNYFAQRLEEMATARRKSGEAGRSGFYASVRPASATIRPASEAPYPPPMPHNEPFPTPVWKQVQEFLDDLDLKYGAQADALVYGARLREAGFADFVTQDARTLQVTVGRLRRRFRGSDTDALEERLLGALRGQDDPTAPKPPPAVGRVHPTGKESRRIEDILREFHAAHASERAGAKAPVAPPAEKPTVPVDEKAFLALTREELYEFIEADIAADLRDLGDKITTEELRRWARPQYQQHRMTSTRNAKRSARCSKPQTQSTTLRRSSAKATKPSSKRATRSSTRRSKTCAKPDNP